MLSSADQNAVRFCAQICWRRRKELQLSDAELEQVLIAWMTGGTNAEAEAASELLAARRKAEAKQAEFDALLSAAPAPQTPSAT